EVRVEGAPVVLEKVGEVRVGAQDGTAQSLERGREGLAHAPAVGIVHVYDHGAPAAEIVEGPLGEGGGLLQIARADAERPFARRRHLRTRRTGRDGEEPLPWLVVDVRCGDARAGAQVPDDGDDVGPVAELFGDLDRARGVHLVVADHQLEAPAADSATRVDLL